MVCTIHRWFRWSNIWFASYIDGIESLFEKKYLKKKNSSHTQIVQMVCAIRRWQQQKKKIFFRSGALFAAPGQGPGVS